MILIEQTFYILLLLTALPYLMIQVLLQKYTFRSMGLKYNLTNCIHTEATSSTPILGERFNPLHLHIQTVKILFNVSLELHRFYKRT